MRWEDLERELDAVPGAREAFESRYPYEDVALALGDVRVGLDMTQTEFGELVGVPQSTVARLESGRQNPSVGMLQRIAKATDTELVIEFRTPERKRRAKSDPKTASLAGDARPTHRVAASSND